MKKAQGLSLNVINIAALALIVLIVLVSIFTGRIGTFGKGLSACSGTCVISRSSCTGNTVAIPIKNCNSDDDASPEIEGDGYCCLETS